MTRLVAASCFVRLMNPNLVIESPGEAKPHVSQGTLRESSVKRYVVEC